MAQEKSPNEKPRRPRKPKVMNDAPLVEQITELMMIHNKSDPKAGVQVVSEIDKDGKVKTVPADEKTRKLHQEFLEPVQGTDPFPPASHDLPRLQGEQAGDQGPGGREKDGRGEGVPQTLRDPSEREQRGTKHEQTRDSHGKKRNATAGTPATE